jgi:predicted amidohydrolase
MSKPMPSVIRVAAAQYAADRLASVDEFKAKLDRWVRDAASNGAKLLVFPEFFGMEIALIGDQRKKPDRRSPDRHTAGPLPVTPVSRRKEQSLEWETDTVQTLLPDFVTVFSEFAARHEVFILAGSMPVRRGNSELRNRAYFFSADGRMGFQDKIVPTRWEREYWGITGGDEVRVFETDFGPIGVAVCYDVEFPQIARLQAQAGARMVLVPCCADSARGYHRVRVGARARALENQAYVIQSPAIGEAAWSRILCVAVGSAGVYAPPDLGPNVNGIIVQGTGKKPEWIYADLDLSALDRLRQGDHVIANEEEWNSHLAFNQVKKVAYEAAAKHNLLA